MFKGEVRKNGFAFLHILASIAIYAHLSTEISSYTGDAVYPNFISNASFLKGLDIMTSKETIPTLIEQALAVRENAYAPYSGFQVGAVLAAADGRLFYGCNVENASYSMTICAERSALCAAVSAGVRKFHKLAVVGGRTAEEARTKPCTPCGACLQVLAEFCPPAFPILLTDGVHLLGELFPVQFQL